MLATLVRCEGIGVLMCETVCRTPNNTVKNQLISLLLKQRSSASFFLKISAETWQIFTLHSLKSFASCLFTLCTITKSRNSCFFLHHTLHLFPRRFDHWLRDVGLAVDDSRKVIAQRCHRYFSDQLVQRDCSFASTSTRFVHVEIRSSRTRVIWFGKSRTIVDLRRTHSCSLDLYQRIVCYCLPPSTSSQYKHSNLHNSTIPSDSLPYWVGCSKITPVAIITPRKLLFCTYYYC